MEPTTPIEVQPVPVPEPGLLLTPEAQYYLRETGKWANFLSIVGFIMCAIFIIVALSIGTIFSMIGHLSPMYSQIPSAIGTVITVVFILVAVLYFFFPFYLYQFASRIKKSIILSDKDEVAQALGKLKSFFKLAGIVTIILLCIYAFELLAVVKLISSMPSYPSNPYQ